MMMSLLLVSLYEFKQFLQIVLWIALPGTLVAIGITTYLHYRRKKKEAGELIYPEEHGFQLVMANSLEQDTTEPLPDWLASSDPDNTSLLKKYEQEIRRYKENYAILEQDFRDLEDKYADLRTKAYRTDKQEDGDLVRQLQKELKESKLKITQLQQAAVFAEAGPDGDTLSSLQSTIQQLQEDLRTQQAQKETLAEEIKRLESLLKNMEQSALTAREEAAHLQECFNQQVEELGQKHRREKNELSEQLRQLQTANTQAPEPSTKEPVADHGDRVKELQQLLALAEEEKTALKNKLNEGDYLQDLAQEKKLQVDFLQNQLEQRIRNYHNLEQQAGETATQLRQLQTTVDHFDQRIQTLTEELQHKQEEVSNWQSTAEHNKKEKQQQQEALRSKVDHIGTLENNLQELQQEQGALQSVIADKQDAMMALQDHLLKEQQKAKELESKLELSSQLLVRIYSELAKSLNAGWMQWQNGPVPLTIGEQETPVS